MNAESATDNVWADAGHAPPGNIASQTKSSHVPVEPPRVPVKPTVHTKNVTDDEQPVEKKSNLSTKIYKGCKTITVKAWRAHHALLVAFGFVCWLVLTLLTVHSAATGVRGILMPSYRTTMHRLNNIKSEQSLLLSKLEDLQDIHLQKRSFETHLECLIRATNIAQDHYDDLPFQSYPLVAEYTTQWAQSECDKILFSPVPIPRSGWHWFWKALVDQAGAAFFRCKDMVDGLMKAKKQRLQKSSSNAQQLTLSLPSGFRLGCNEAESLCHLLFLPLQSLSTSGSPSTEEMNLIVLGRRLLRIIDVCKRVRKLIAVVWWLVPWVNLMVLALQLIIYG
ncbi:uncharacterized protein CC84DRAFT_1202642 [Paraphaeosphaeria sporulosa]|uniref:Uncharacterized protein n=1 Tax=Paraphaeosphaeria sporulosa TaxID=1460663 RepID=A0A177CRF5_9PLEO|nr:uncharacterized protein CC84DRAFT_1202642 [Paraphaeosphaeria sporulosa]OAG10103.1 hypothetical protein CC84DRAFT_1202642 [Paraphaeosphaeria sporulosa]